MRKIKMLVVGVVMAAVVSGCGSTSASTESDAVDTVESDAVSETVTTEDGSDEVGDVATEDAIKIEDIDWNVAAGVIDGESLVVLSYTNNSSYTITELALEFEQRDDVTDDDRSVFDDFVAKKDIYDEEDKESFAVYSHSKIIAESGETVKQIPCFINDVYYLETMEQYELMTPTMATIRYLADDGKLYYIYYDFETEAYGSSSYGGEDSQEWSDSELASIIPKPEAVVISVVADKDTDFRCYTYGVSYEYYESYVEMCEEAGFTDVKSEGDAHYEAYNEDGYLVRVYFDSSDETMSCECRIEE